MRSRIGEREREDGREELQGVGLSLRPLEGGRGRRAGLWGAEGEGRKQDVLEREREMETWEDGDLNSYCEDTTPGPLNHMLKPPSPHL